MLDSYQALIDDFKDRGYGGHACYYAKYALYASYYELSHQAWKLKDIEEQKTATYKRICEFYYKNELLIKHCDEKATEQIIKVNESIAKRKGPMNEMPPFEEWLNSIITIWRNV